MNDATIHSAMELIPPVVEGAMVAAAHYAKACGRKTVTTADIQYGMRYCAQTVAGKHVGTLFPELQGSDGDDNDDDDDDDDGSDDGSDIETVEEDDEPFTLYAGDDEIVLAMNRAYDAWDEWVPYSPLEKILKAAIDNAS